MKAKKKNSGNIQSGLGEVPYLQINIPFTDPSAGPALQAVIDLLVKDQTTSVNDIAELIEQQEDVVAWQIANGVIAEEETTGGGQETTAKGGA